MNANTRWRRSGVALTLAALAGGTTALGLLLSGPESVQRAYAEPVLSLSLGYYDQTSTNFFSVDADSEDPSPGMFLLAVPGVGVFWSADPVDIHEEIDGSLAPSFDGEGYLDDEADLAGSAGQ